MVNEDSSMQQAVTRRRFMLLAASTTVGSALLAACGGNNPGPTVNLTPAPTANTLPQAQIDATIAASKGKTYFPGSASVPDAYTVPPPVFQSVKYVPGSGKKVTAFEILYNKPVVPKAQNKYWQELDKRLNVQWEAVQVGSEDYDTKAALQLNSNKPADLFYLNPSATGGSLLPIYTKALQDGAFNDLTSFLSGNGLKDFPNLARISSAIWQNSRFQGKIYGIPRSRTLLPNVLMYRKDITDKLGLEPPKNPDEFFAWLTKITSSNLGGRKVYGYGGRAFFGNNQFVNQIYGVPNGWRVESDGSFTYYIETDEFKQALDFERRAWQAGLYHPDAPVANNKQSKDGYEAAQYASYLDGAGAIVPEEKRVKQKDPNGISYVMIPQNNQGKFNRHQGPGWLGMTGIPTNATQDPERIKELLRIMDYLTAPVFSWENIFLSYGIDGWDNDPTKDGKKQSDRGLNEMNELTAVASSPPVYYVPEEPSYATYQQLHTQQSLEQAIPDPTWGLTSPSWEKLSGTLGQLRDSDMLRIATGKDPLSALSDAVKRWRDQGGSKVKQEYADAYKKLHK